MIDEIAIGRALDMAETREAAVERVAEPLDDIAGEREEQPFGRKGAERIAEEDRSCPSSEEVARIAGNIGGCHLLRAFAVAEIEIAQHAGEVTARPEDVGRVS